MIKQMFFFSFKLIKLECLPEPHAKKSSCHWEKKEKNRGRFLQNLFLFWQQVNCPKRCVQSGSQSLTQNMKKKKVKKKSAHICEVI